MDRSRFEALVRRMERFAEAAPAAYRAWVYTLALLGYASLIALVLTLCALLIALVALGFAHHATYVLAKFALVLGALLVAVLRALWVRLEAPEGEPLARDTAPGFFALLDRLAVQLRTPRIHAVLITPDLNAAVTQVPRLGIFGWYRNYLLIGLPLMKSLSPGQFEAVLAHELGHLSRGHARMANWIYRLRRVWARLDGGLERRPRWGSFAIRRALRWYVPYFNACSFPLARRNEFEADASSVQLTSATAAAQALTNVSVLSACLRERYWPAVHARARDSALPAFAPYGDLNTAALQDLGAGAMPHWLERALAEPTTCADTHPSLGDRLAAIGMQADLALPPADQAADRLLGAHSARLAEHLDARWRDRVGDSWKKVYENTQSRRNRLAALRPRAAAAGTSAAGGLTALETVELADLEEDLGEGAAHALALRRELLARDPAFVPARFALGRQLLAQNDPDGVPLVESALAAEPDAMLPGSELLRDYFWRRGERERARQWHERALVRARTLEEAKQERARLHPKDVWLAHGLDPLAIAALTAGLREAPGLRRAYLVRKQLTYQSERPLYVLGFSVCVLGFVRAARARRVKEQLLREVEFPGQTLIISVEGVNATFERKFRRVPGARIL